MRMKGVFLDVYDRRSMRNNFFTWAALLAAFFVATSISKAASPNSARFQVDTTQLGDVIGNKVKTINLWQFQTWSKPSVDEGCNLSEFVEYVQFMQATGGNATRDLFVDPTNHDVLDDYDFQPLVDKCRDVFLILVLKRTVKINGNDLVVVFHMHPRIYWHMPACEHLFCK